MGGMYQLANSLETDEQGANWSAYAVNKAEEERERATFHHFDRLAETHPELVIRTPFLYVASQDLYGQGWWKDLVRNVSHGLLLGFGVLTISIAA
jgi:hypothetical protein